MPDPLERARLLHDQRRYDLAAAAVGQVLVESPDDASAHALLALCLVNLDRPKEALDEATEAIRLSPDDPRCHYTHAFILGRTKKLGPAEAAISEAIRIYPFDAAFFRLLAQIRLEQSNWRGALEASDRGLALEPDNVACANARSRALIKLGRTTEALQAVDSALTVEPDNASSHANKAWALLESGDTDQALAHFREALRLQPGMEWARSGMVVALKSRYLVYRIVLGYFFWMARLPKNVRYGVIGGLWLLSMLRTSVHGNPGLAVISKVIGGIYMVFCFTTWTVDPLFNAALRFNSFGRYLLTRKQVIVSNFVAAAFLSGVLSLVIWLFRHRDGELILGFGSLLMTWLIAMASRAATRGIIILLSALLGTIAVLLLVGAFAAGF